MAASMRSGFVDSADQLLSERDDVAVVLAEISVGLFEDAGVFDRHPERIFNVGIREQLQVGFAAGLAKEGFKPIIHTYAPFLVERAFEQVKLDFGHQGFSGVLVSVGASYDSTASGRTHHSPGDVALISTLPGFEIHIPGHPHEAEALIRHSVAAESSAYVRLSDQSNVEPRLVDGKTLAPIRLGSAGHPVVIAVGPTLDRTLTAVEDLDVTVLYATTVRPFDAETLSEHAATDVIVVEPYLEGTSAHEITSALQDRSHRLLSIGVTNTELRRYGSIPEHDAAHGLTTPAIRERIQRFLG